MGRTPANPEQDCYLITEVTDRFDLVSDLPKRVCHTVEPGANAVQAAVHAGVRERRRGVIEYDRGIVKSRGRVAALVVERRDRLTDGLNVLLRHRWCSISRRQASIPAYPVTPAASRAAARVS